MNHQKDSSHGLSVPQNLRESALRDLGQRPELAGTDWNAVEFRPVSLTRKPDGTLTGIVQADHEMLCEFEVRCEGNQQTLHVMRRSGGFRLLGWHGPVKSQHKSPYLLDVRYDRRELLPETTDTNRYSLAAADFGGVFQSGETPELFFHIVAEPGLPRNVRIELVGLSQLAGRYTAEFLVYDRDDRDMAPVDPKTGELVPLQPQTLELQPLTPSTLTESACQLVERCREAHPGAEGLVGTSLSWQISGTLRRGDWIVFRVRRADPEVDYSDTGLQQAYGKRIGDGMYLVERPAAKLAGNGKVPSESSGWMLDTQQLDRLSQRLILLPGTDYFAVNSTYPDEQCAIQDTFISFVREIRRGELNKTLTNTKEQQIAALRSTHWRKRHDITRSRNGVRRSSRSKSAGMKAEPKRFLAIHDECDEPATLNQDISLVELQTDLNDVLRRIEPCELHRTMFHVCHAEIASGATNVMDWAAELFGISKRTLYRYFAKLRSQLEILR